jgi:hypothetical protein
VQAQLGAVAGLQGTDEFAAGHDVADRERRENGFIAREDAARMGDRQHVPVDD